MVEKLDGLVKRYALLIVSVADFFGISKQHLMYIWTLIGCISWAAVVQGNIYYILITSVAVGAMMFLGMVPMLYLLTVIMDRFHLGNFSFWAQGVRLLLVLASIATSFLTTNRYGHGTPHLSIFLFKFLCPYLLWLYFFDEDDHPKKKYRLKNWLKEMLFSQRRNILPNPAPESS